MRETLKFWTTKSGLLSERQALLVRVLGAFIIFLMFFAVAWGRLDPDFGWHLSTGNYILAHGIPRHDIYTYTAKGHPWIDHEWGSDIIQALLYKVGGYFLDAIFFSLLWTGAVLLLGRGVRFWILFLASLSMLPYAGIRPIAWSVFFFALILKALVHKKTWRWALPLLFVPWANLHAGFIAGLCLIAYYLAKERTRSLLFIFLSASLLTLVNVYGINLYTEVAHTVFDPAIHNQIVEWHRFYITLPSKPYVFLWASGFLLFARPLWKRWVSLSPLLFIVALSASRNLPFFSIASMSEVNGYISAAKAKLPTHRDFQQRLILSLSALIIIFSIIYASFVAFMPYKNRYYDYPVQSVAYLKSHGCPGRLFNDYNYGGYLIWKLPSQKVYIDGRMVVWIKHMQHYLGVVNNPAANYRQQFDQYDVKCALLSHQTTAKLITVLEKQNWKTVVNSPYSILLMKQVNRQNNSLP